jgi:dienelactone hydrolase
VLVDVRATSRALSQPAVVIVHGFKGFKDFGFLAVMAERLARGGFTAVTLSVSGSGVDADGEFTLLEQFARNTYTREMHDIEMVIAQMRAGALDFAPPTSLGMIGHSRGGGVALCVARETPAVDAIVTWSAISTIRRYADAEVRAWKRLGTIHVENSRTRQLLPMHYEIVEDALAHEDRFDIEAAARAITIPWLLVHGTDDETVPVQEGRLLAAEVQAPHFEALFVEGARHGFGGTHPWTGPTPHTEILFGATMRFFSRHLA